jgi:hypothetical protein
MKTLHVFTIAVTLLLAAGCGLSPTKVKVRVVEHKVGGAIAISPGTSQFTYLQATNRASGAYYALLCQVLEPKNLEGRYLVAATLRSDLITNVDGGEFEVYLNFTMVGGLDYSKPLDYDISPASRGDGDFLDSAKRIK